MRCAALLLLAALLPLAAAARRGRGLAADAPVVTPLDVNEKQAWFMDQTDTYDRRSVDISLPGGKTFTLVLPRMLKDSEVRGRPARAGRRGAGYWGASPRATGSPPWLQLSPPLSAPLQPWTVVPQELQRHVSCWGRARESV